jgi:SAM-dependent methyltransferase
VSTDPVERRDVWTRYWSSGMPHSCGTSYESTYGGAVGRFWRDAFAGLDETDRVLDLATGNAALPRLLCEAMPDALAECDAIDIAQVSPPWLSTLDPQRRQRIRIHAGVGAETLPFAQGTFSLVISQYGIEYADLTRAIPEVLRVRSPAGRIRLLAHHSSSQPVLLARHEIEHIDWLLASDGLLDRASAMVEPIRRSVTEQGRASLARDAAAGQARARFDEVQASLARRLASARCPDVLHEARDWVAQAFRAGVSAGVTAGQHALDQVRVQLVDSRLRLVDLCRHALDEPAVRSLCLSFSAVGLRTTALPLADQGHLLGWAVSADPGG